MVNRPQFCPSLMCADLLKLQEQLALLNPRASSYHMDIMDGHFVPNLALSPYFVKATASVATVPLDCHLMVTHPEQYLETLAEAGAGTISVHIEATGDPARTSRVLEQIRELGPLAGLVLNPDTPFSRVEEFLPLVQRLTIMTVQPGFAGQPFVPGAVESIRRAAQLRKERGLDFVLEVDGACNKKTYKLLWEAGADAFVLGSTGLFGLGAPLADSWEQMLREFQEETGAETELATTTTV